MVPPESSERDKRDKRVAQIGLCWRHTMVGIHLQTDLPVLTAEKRRLSAGAPELETATTAKVGARTSLGALKQVVAGTLNVAYAEAGPAGGPTVILLHGWPYDIHGFDFEKRLAQSPVITVPAVTMEGDANGAPHLDPSAYAKQFTGKYAHRTIGGGIGHNLPQEAPAEFAKAVIDVDGFAS